MKFIFCLLTALLNALAVYSFPASLESTLPECVDPTFACQDLESARSCGVVNSCIHDIWSTMSAPEDNDEICDICKEMVKEARDQLLSNMTQEEIKEVFEGSCKLLPVKLIADACMKLVDEFIPELVDMLASRMDPNMVCTVSGLCNLAHLPIKAPLKEKSKVHDELVCEFCTHVLQHVKDLITTNTTMEEFRTALQNFCKHTGSFSSRCSELVNEYYDKVFGYIQSLDPKGFCTLISLCTSEHHSKHVIQAAKLTPAVKMQKAVPLVRLIPAQQMNQFNTHANEILGSYPEQLPVDRILHPSIIFEHRTECAFCRAVSFYLMTDLDGSRSEKNVKKAIEQVCSRWVSEYPEHCTAFVSKYSGYLEDHIMTGKEYNDLCTSIRSCSTDKNEGISVKVIAPSSFPFCDPCKAAFNEIEMYLKNPTSKKEMEAFLSHLCTYLPEAVQEDCHTFINQNVDTLFDFLEQELTGSNVCPALGLCPGKYLKPGHLKSIECDVCKDFVQQLQKRLQDPDVKQSLQDLLERTCSVLPTELANECKTFVDQNIQNLINILVQDIDPNLVCSALKLCDTSVNVPAPEIKDLECDLCKEVVEKLDDQLKDQRTEEEIRKALDEVCSYLPSSLSTKCESFVDKYSSILITLLIEEMDPNLVCAALKICPAKDLECESCQYVFHFIQNQLMSSQTQDTIKADFKRICKLLPANFSENCVAYIDEYGSSLLVIIAQYLDPSSICYSLRACGNTSRAMQMKNLKQPDFDECTLCKTVVDYMDKLLEEDNVDKEITQLIEKVCGVIPSTMKDKCSVLIETYGPYMLQMIGQLANSQQVCQAIDVCPHSTGHVHLLGGQKCTFGPSYWCKSSAHAAACKAEEYCSKKEWKN